MANLKSYSCPKCGGVLSVDIDKDMIDCPFCGSRFSYIEFHRKDLLDVAEDLLKRGEFAQAKEKYLCLLKEGSTDFRTLQGYLFSVANIKEAGKLNDINFVSRCNEDSIKKLVENDERYSQGNNKDYFQALLELVQLAHRYAEAKRDLNEHNRRSSRRNTTGYYISEEERQSRILYAIVAITAAIGFYLAFRLAEFIKIWGFVIVFGIIIAEFIVHFVRHPAKTHSEKKQEYYGSKGEDIRKEGEKEPKRLESIVQYSENTFNKTIKKLEKLTPKTTDKTETVSKTDTAADTKGPDDEPICAKCGGILTHNKELKLYFCNHCGLTYGYALVFGEPRKKAKDEMRRGEFGTAIKRYLKILSADPHDFDALRGTILCAGKWIDFSKVSLSDIKIIDLDKVSQCTNIAVTNCSPEYKQFFDEVRTLVNILSSYYQNLIMTEMEPNNPKYQKESASIISFFDFQLRKVTEWDARLTSISPEKREELRTSDKSVVAAESLEERDFSTAAEGYTRVLSEDPQNVLAWRGIILCALQSATIYDLRKKIFSLPADIKHLEITVTQAMTSTTSEYAFYFNEYLNTFAILEKYQKINREYNQLCRQKEKYTNVSLMTRERYLDYGFKRELIRCEQERNACKTGLKNAVEDLIQKDLALFGNPSA